MNDQGVILRETAVSVVINIVISIGFFMAVFGLAAPVALRRMAVDFLPQTFMVTLMGTMVPTLILGGKMKASRAPIIVRSIGLAIVMTVIVGGGAVWLCGANSAISLSAMNALLLKAAYGGLLAAFVTPIALIALFRSPGSIR